MAERLTTASLAALETLRSQSQNYYEKFRDFILGKDDRIRALNEATQADASGNAQLARFHRTDPATGARTIQTVGADAGEKLKAAMAAAVMQGDDRQT